MTPILVLTRSNPKTSNYNFSKNQFSISVTSTARLSKLYSFYLGAVEAWGKEESGRNYAVFNFKLLIRFYDEGTEESRES